MSYTVRNHNTNTTITKIAKSKAYLMWMYHHVYSEQCVKGSACGYDAQAQTWVIDIY